MAICYVPSTTNKASNIKLKDTNDNYTSNDVEGALEEVNEQFKDIAKDVLLEDGKLYLKKSDGNKIGDGVILPVSGGGGSITWENVTGKPATFTPSSHSHSKSDITDFPTIPTKTSQLTNDSGYLTEHQDISGKADKTDLHNHTNKEILDSITQDKINQWNNGGNSEDNSTIPKLSTICVKDESGDPLLTLDFDLIPKDKSTVYLNDVFSTVQGNGILKIRRDGVDRSLGILTTDYMLVTIGYKTSNNTLLITNTRNATEFDFNTNTRTNNDLSSLNGKAGTSTVLTKTNKTEYTPTSDYNPATKKYVDDKFKEISIFPLDAQTTMEAVETGELSAENNQLVVDWFNEVKNDDNYFSCLFVGLILDIWLRGRSEIKMTKVIFDGVGLTAHTIMINKSAEDKITIIKDTQEFSLTPKLE